MSKAVCAFEPGRDIAGEHKAVAEALRPGCRRRQRLLDARPADAVEIARDRDVEAADLVAFGVEEEDVGLSDRRADDVGAARRADDRVGDLGIGDQHVLDVARQVDHHRLADAERNEARVGVAADHLDAAGIGGDRPLIAGRGGADRGDPERGDRCGERGGADQHCSCHVAVPCRRFQSGCRHRGAAKADRVAAAGPVAFAVGAGRRVASACDAMLVGPGAPRRRRRAGGPTRSAGRSPARSSGDGGHDAARGFHTLTFHITLRPEYRKRGATAKPCPVG